MNTPPPLAAEDLEVLEGVRELAERERDQIALLREELRIGMATVTRSLNLLREAVLDLHQAVRNLAEDRRTLEAKVTVLESEMKRLGAEVER